MKIINFKRLAIQNFLSVGYEPVVVDFNQGINLITGINKDKPDRRNAIGKSTVADALYFAIFGETLRELKKDLIVNNVTGGSTCVVLHVDVVQNNTTTSYKITRQLNPSKISIQENDVDITRDTIANTNKFINELLNATPSVFQNCVIMTVNNAVPFMAKNKVEKRKFIEDIFGLEVFGNMLSILRGEYNELKKQFEIESSKLNEIEISLNNYREQQKKTLETRREKLELYKRRQTENTKQKQALEQQIAEFQTIDVGDVEEKLTKLNTGLNTCDDKITGHLQKITEVKTKVKFLQNTHSKIGTDEEKCPVCLRDIAEHNVKYIEEEKNKIKEEVAALSAEIQKHERVVDEIKTKKETIKKAVKAHEQQLVKQQLQNQTKQSINEKIQQIDCWQQSLVEDIEQVSNTHTDFDDVINQTQKRVDEVSGLVSDFNKKFSVLDVVKYVVSEEGVKSYIVNKLLTMLNSKLAYYLSKLDSNAVCYFNEFFEEEILNEKNKICSYFNFSGAERKSIDLACLFAFSDLRRMQGGVQYNIAIYDELFDSSFDEKGLEFVTEILKERAEKYQECIYIISHRRESIKAVTGEVVFLEKQNGVTQRKDFVDVML